MAKLLLLIGAGARTNLRWAWQHLYALLVLGPLVLGISYATASRIADNVPSWSPPGWLVAAIAVAFVLALTGLNLSRASAEIYHVRQPEFAFEVFPFAASVHFHFALVIRLVRTSLVAAVALAARPMLGQPIRFGLEYLPHLGLFVVLTSLSEVLAALNWIHSSHTGRKGPAIGVATAMLPAAILAGLALVVVINPGALSPRNREGVILAGMAYSVAAYLLARVAHSRWRSIDIEFANRLRTTGRLKLLDAGRLRNRLGSALAAQLGRDIRLTVRGFSSAVYVAATISALWLVLLLVGLITAQGVLDGLIPVASSATGWLDATWLPPVVAVKLACVMMCATLVSLSPVLTSYELPHLWLERAMGTTGLDIWRAKLSYARVVSAPAPWLSWFGGFLTGALPGSYALAALAECLWLWWLIGSIAGSLSFEMPQRTGLSIIVIVTLGLGAGLFATVFWPGGVIVYFLAMQSLTDRGRARARYYLMTEED